MSLYKNIQEYCFALEQEFSSIPNTRKAELERLSNYLKEKFQKGTTPKIIVICTHNSRRSHLGQIWLAVGADYYGLPKIESYSGGTEATAFNPRAVTALKKIGFDISIKEENHGNPIYNVQWKEAMPAYLAFSKKYEMPPNPQEDFGAILVCNSANEACPIVFGSDFRIALPYDDPKAFDDTGLEAAKYSERARQIGREMFYVLAQLK